MDVQTIYYIAATIVSGITIVGALLKVKTWYARPADNTVNDEENKPDEGDEPESEEQIACDNCHRVFTPKWKQRSSLLSKEEYAKCPYCGEENVFEIEEQDDEEGEDEEDDE